MQQPHESDQLSSLTQSDTTTAEAEEGHDAAKMATTAAAAGGTDPSQSIDNDSLTGPLSHHSNASCPNGLNDETGQEDESSQDAAAGDDPDDRCENDPNFAVICSFFVKFGHALGISYSIDDLKVMLEDHVHGESNHIECQLAVMIIHCPVTFLFFSIRCSSARGIDGAAYKTFTKAPQIHHQRQVGKVSGQIRCRIRQRACLGVGKIRIQGCKDRH
jgi:hypothetical protein